MLKTIYWYFYFMFSAFLSYPQLLKAKKLVKEGKMQEAELLAHEVSKQWALKQIKNAGGDIRIHGKENLPKDSNAVFISNHQGNFDIAIFMGCIDVPKGYVSKVEVKKIPIIRSWMTYMNCVFMDRSTLKTSAAAIVEGVNLIKNGHSLVIFPEGTRSRCDQMAEFKGGSFKLATKPKAPIIPVTIDGSYKLMEGNGGKVTPGVVDVYIHPPIDTASLSKEELATLPTTVQDIIATKLPS